MSVRVCFCLLIVLLSSSGGIQAQEEGNDDNSMPDSFRRVISIMEEGFESWISKLEEALLKEFGESSDKDVDFPEIDSFPDFEKEFLEAMTGSENETEEAGKMVDEIEEASVEIESSGDETTVAEATTEKEETTTTEATTTTEETTTEETTTEEETTTTEITTTTTTEPTTTTEEETTTTEITTTEPTTTTEEETTTTEITTTTTTEPTTTTEEETTTTEITTTEPTTTTEEETTTTEITTPEPTTTTEEETTTTEITTTTTTEPTTTTEEETTTTEITTPEPTTTEAPTTEQEETTTEFTTSTTKETTTEEDTTTEITTTTTTPKETRPSKPAPPCRGFVWDGHCFYAKNVNRIRQITYEQGDEMCRKRYRGHPANIDEEELFDIAMEYIRDKSKKRNETWLWLGMTYNPMSNVLYLYNGTETEFAKWYPGEPHTGSMYEDFTQVAIHLLKNEPGHEHQGMLHTRPIYGHDGVLCSSDHFSELISG